MSVKRIYLAGPFFNEDEIKNIEYAETVIREKGVSFFSPMRHEAEGEPGTPKWAWNVFIMDRNEIDRADAVIALYYGSSGDTGTAWECGYAWAKGKPVVLVHIKRDSDSNIMMHCGCTTNIYIEDLKDFDLDSMPVYEYTGKMF